jgi:electron transport complex protein RnfG
MIQPSASAARMYAVVLGVGVACALAIVTVYETTRTVIRRKTIELRNQAILDVLPAARTSAAFRLNEAGQFERTPTDSTDSNLVFAGYDADNNLVGLAIEADGMGYQDVVRVLYGYSFDQQAIVGIRVLQSRETPGLGDRIETDADFLRNFEALDVRLNPTGDELVHTIEFVKPGEKHAAWQIDGISGATITSRATAAMLRDSAAKWIPRVYPRRADFQYASPED